VKAITYHAPADLRVERVPDPVLLAPTDALVRVRLAAICGSDLHVWHGRETGLDPSFYLFRRRPRDEILPWDLIDNGVSKDYFWRELVKSEKELLSPHCPEIQGCIRCGVCIETPNPSYAVPEKWKGRETLPLYEKLGARGA